MKTLYELLPEMRQMEDILEETGGELTPELEGLWQETSTSLVTKVDGYNDLLNHLEGYSKNLDTEIKRLQALKKTADNSYKRVTEHLKDAMIAFGFTKLEGERCKVSLSTSTSTEVDDDVVLQPYLSRLELLHLPAWITADLKVSKTALKEAFKGKDVMPAGVTFKENKSLRRR